MVVLRSVIVVVVGKWRECGIDDDDDLRFLFRSTRER